MLVHAQATYGERVDQTIKGVKILAGNVDRIVIIADETVTKEQTKTLKDLGCEVYMHPWEEDFPRMRNHYLAKLQDGDWVIVSDPDEWFCDEFAREARTIALDGDKNEINLFLIPAKDINLMPDGSTSEKFPSEKGWAKNLMFKYALGTRYVNVGTTNVHEHLELTSKGRVARLDFNRYWYTHYKEWHEVWERAARNLLIGGGGNNVGETNPSWKSLKEIAGGLGVEKWNDLRDYLRKGNVDEKLKTWMNNNRTKGFDWDNEEAELWMWYFEYLHPEENTDGLVVIQTDPKLQDAMNLVDSAYIEVLGRAADPTGKQIYTKHLLSKKMTREQLIDILKQSDEFKNRVSPQKALAVALNHLIQAVQILRGFL